MIANDILKLLQLKHKADVIIPECKTGATIKWSIDTKPLRLDAWVMKCKWVNPDYIGYEIKVSRADFLSDKKWKGYLRYCTKFYFVCPKGLIEADELPEQIGLIYANEKNLYTKRKCTMSNTQIETDYQALHNIMKYAMWWRMNVKETK